MISLINVVKFLRPDAEWTLNGDTYNGLNWLDKIQTKPTEEEIADGYIKLSDKHMFNHLKKEKTTALEAAYIYAQQVKVVYSSTTFLIPIIGEFFTSSVANQVLEAQISGSASLILQDIHGDSCLIKDVPFSDWQKFYKESKIIAFDNILRNNRIVSQISAATTIDDLQAIDVNIFPEVPFIRL